MSRDTRRLILASASPRRRELLGGLGLAFEVRPVDIDESPREGEEPEALVRRLAVEKAAAYEAVHGDSAQHETDDALVIAADTLVVLDGAVLGKPRDQEEAVRMLGALSGRTHTVLTGVAVRDLTTGTARDTVVATEVDVAPLDPERIAWYVATGEPMDKAGSYAIQGLGALLVESIRGNYTNVVGLPLPALRALVDDLGRDLLEFRTS